jgi:hypothetical protein
MSNEPKIMCEYCLNEDESMLEVSNNSPNFIYIFCNICSRQTTISKIQTDLKPLGTIGKSDG